MTTPHAVSCHGLHKTFGQGDTAVHALRHVDFEVRFGELAFIVGPSGSGKTTLLSLIAGLLTPSGGQLRVLGQDLSRLRDRDLVMFRRKHLGFVFQQYNLLPGLTAAENVAVPLMAAGRRTKEAVEAGTALLADLRMSHRAASRPTQLSGGEQQRVALARALVHEPQLIVCDEPTSALDAVTGHAVMELLVRTAVAPNRAVIVVTHDARILDFADRMAFMEDGAITRVETRRRPSTEYGSSFPEVTHA